MDFFKNLLAMAVLAAAGYWVYQSIQGRPALPPEMEQLAADLAGAPPRTAPPTGGPVEGGINPLFPAMPGAAPAIAAATNPGPSVAPPSAFPTLPEAAPPVTSENTTAPAARAAIEGAMARVQEHLDRNELPQALRLLTEWYEDPRLSAEQNEELVELLDQLAGAVVYSRQHLLAEPYVVQPGDTLESVAERYRVSWQLLAKINGLANPKQLRPGERLKVMTGPFEALVDVRRHELTLLVGDLYAGRFPIGVGRDGSTPMGSFQVLKKVVNPSWAGPQGEVAPGDPANPLGGRWIDLGGGIGIHGTNDPGSIGKSASEGCIRLGAPDIEDVFDILVEGSKVTITGGGAPSPVAGRVPANRQ
jgi:LysM repeat protein